MDNNEKLEIAKTTAEQLAPTISERIKEELKAQLAEITSKVKPSKEDEEIQKEIKDNKFKSFGEFMTSIYRLRKGGEADNRLRYIDKHGRINAVEKALAEGTDSAGGFLVPEIFQAELFQLALENSLVEPNGAMVVPMTSDTLLYPRVNDTTHASSVFGGIVAYWTAEAATMTASQPAFGQVRLQANELTGYTQVSNVLMQDSAISLEPFLKRAFAEAWAWYRDLAFIRGTGSGQPLGILNAGALVSVTRQDTDEVFIQDIINLYSRMLPASRDRAVWFMNHEVLGQLMRMVSANATPAATKERLVFIGNVVDPIKKTIFGRPYFVTEKMSALGDAGDIGFFDLSYYLIGNRQPLTIDVSEHVAFTSNQIAWRFVTRVDGQPWLASAITPYKGTATLSPFVTLSATS